MNLHTQIVKELVSQEAVERTFLVAAAAGPAAGLAIGILIGKLKRRSKQCAAAGFLLGLLLCGIYGMWRIFNAITDSLRLDSLANLAVQLVLFSAVGAAAGLAAARVVILLNRNA